MKRIVSIARSHEEAEAMEVDQQVSLTLDQRRRIVRALQRRVYGPNPPGLRPGRPRPK